MEQKTLSIIFKGIPVAKSYPKPENTLLNLIGVRADYNTVQSSKKNKIKTNSKYNFENIVICRVLLQTLTSRTFII